MEALLAECDSPDKFDAVADTLLHRCEIYVGACRWTPVELEFYLWSPSHPDVYSHRKPAQLTNCQWYWHREKSARIGFTLKGVDITFGGSDMYGGVLLRAVRDCDTGQFIDGPSLTVDAFLRAAGHTSVQQLKADSDYSDDCLGGAIHLELLPTANKLAISTGPRIGLDAKKDTADWYSKPYRYRTHSACAKHKRETLSLRQ